MAAKRTTAPAVKSGKARQFRLDPKNHNKGSAKGRELLKKSLEENGAARSVVSTSDGVIIAGNQTMETALEQGMEDVLIVHTTGKQLLIHVRDDVQYGTKEAVDIALSDNYINKVNFVPNVEAAVVMTHEVQAEDWGQLPKLAGQDHQNPGKSDDGYSSFEIVLLYENKLRLSKALQSIRDSLGVTVEDALMHLVTLYDEQHDEPHVSSNRTKKRHTV